MNARPAPLFETLSGFYKDLTIRDTNYGTIISPRANPANPKTTAQLTVRTAFVTAYQRWGTLTDVQHQGWTAWAKPHRMDDAQGNTFTLNRFQKFVSANAMRLRILGLPALDHPLTNRPTVEVGREHHNLSTTAATTFWPHEGIL